MTEPRRLALRASALLALGAGGLLGGSLSAAPVREAQGSPAAPEVRERWVQVEGGRIRALCTSDSPEVLLLHDRDASASAWMPVLRALQGRVGACAYDRRGHGGSEPAPSVRGWFELLDELREIHEALGPPPHVLVGHGLGGLYARLYSLDRPGEVAGLVLVEPETEGMLEAMRSGMPGDVWRARMDGRGRPNADGVRVDALLLRAERRSLPDRPVTVLTATRRPEGDGWVPRWINEAARRHQGALVAGVRLGRHLPATGSGHDVPEETPALIAEEILRIVRLTSR